MPFPGFSENRIKCHPGERSFEFAQDDIITPFLLKKCVSPVMQSIPMVVITYLSTYRNACDTGGIVNGPDNLKFLR